MNERAGYYLRQMEAGFLWREAARGPSSASMRIGRYHANHLTQNLPSDIFDLVLTKTRTKNTKRSNRFHK